MSHPPSRATRIRWRKWLEAVQAYGVALTPSDRVFLAEVAAELDGPRAILSRPQADRLERLYAEQTP